MLSLIADFVHLNLLLFQNKLSLNFKTWWQWLNKENSEIKPSGEIRFGKIESGLIVSTIPCDFDSRRNFTKRKALCKSVLSFIQWEEKPNIVLKSFTLVEEDDSKIGVILAKVDTG